MDQLFVISQISCAEVGVARFALSTTSIVLLIVERILRNMLGEKEFHFEKIDF